MSFKEFIVIALIQVVLLIIGIIFDDNLTFLDGLYIIGIGGFLAVLVFIYTLTKLKNRK